MKAIGKLMQLVALIVLPVSILVQLSGGLSVGQMLILLVFAFALFWLGRIVEGYSAR